MKMSDMNNDSREIRELSDDALEDVNGGGIREIVAATTLATMVATGMTGAFGLARASAEAGGEVIEGPVEEMAFTLGDDEPTIENDIELIEGEAIEADAVSLSAGDTAIVDTGTTANAGVWKKWDDIAGGKANYSLPNGTPVTLLGSSKYNSSKKRNYVQIEFTHKGKTCKGWIAASIVGLKR